MIALTIVVVIVDRPRGSIAVSVHLLSGVSSTGKHSVGVLDVQVVRRQRMAVSSDYVHLWLSCPFFLLR